MLSLRSGEAMSSRRIKALVGFCIALTLPAIAAWMLLNLAMNATDDSSMMPN